MRLYFSQQVPLIALVLLLYGLVPVSAQQEAPPDTARKDTTVIQVEEAEGENEAPPAPIPGQPTAEDAAVAKAKQWVRHLLFRGWVNPTVIGAYTTYQLTAWGESVGSYGPVDGKLTIQYLGPAEWMKKDAEWFQAVYYTLESEPELIEFDLLVPASQKVTEAYRVLYRVDRGELRSMSFAVPAGQLDYDAVDRPQEEGQKDLRVYAGTFGTRVYRGSGDDGSAVVIYRDEKVLPLEIVVLGYGEEGLTLNTQGSDVTPRFKTPAPPGR